jgi:hypothetical protein
VVDEKDATEDEPVDPLEILILPLPTQPDIVEKPTPPNAKAKEDKYEDEDNVPVVSPIYLLVEVERPHFSLLSAGAKEKKRDQA